MDGEVRRRVEQDLDVACFRVGEFLLHYTAPDGASGRLKRRIE
jgi:hypothetical protein